MVKKILFVCKMNRFRSRVAESYLKKINKKLKIKSVGVIGGKKINRNTKKIVDEFKINISGKPKALDYKILEWADKIVIVGDDIPRRIFKPWAKKTSFWGIKDAEEGDDIEIRRAIKEIIKKVKELNSKILK